MTNHYYSKHFRRQLLVMAAVLLGTTLLLMGLVPPQEAQSKEKKNETAQSQEEQEKTTPADNDAQKEEETTTPAEGDEAQEEEQVLDKDLEGNEYVAGELLVTYKKGAFKKAKDEAPKKISAKVEKDFPEIEVQHLSLPEVKNEQSHEARQKALKQKKEDLEKASDVEAVGYNYVGHGTMTPNDTHYGKQWGYPKINAPVGWDASLGRSNIRIAILDSGIDHSHPDLTGKVVGQWDFVNNDNDASDDVAGGGHGTLFAGIAAANTNNGQGVVGTCPNCSLLDVKVLDKDKSLGTTWSRAIDGINWAVNNGANVINMSFGGKAGDPALQRAIDNAWGKGIILVGSAGNNGTTGPEFYPAAYPNVIAVAATDSNDKRAYYEWTSGSYFGPPGKYMGASNAGPWVDVSAPGKDIYTTTRSIYSVWCSCYIGNYDYSWGTSSAAPHVSGLAALLFSKGGMTNTQVRKKIEENAKDLGTAGKDDVFGFGLIDARAALSRIYEETDPAITYSGSWSQPLSLSGAYGGYVKSSSTRNAMAKLSFTGNGVTWWTTTGPKNGVAYVYVDGSYADELDLYSSENRSHYAAFTKSWSTSGNHTIEIVVEGTYGRPRVDVDRFSVTQPT